MTSQPSFATMPEKTVFIVNVMHCHEGKQAQTLAAIDAVVRYVAQAKPGFRWSTLARSTDGDTVGNIEAISGVDDVEAFFADSEFRRLWERVGKVSRHEFHTYAADAVILPGADR
ncbi:hypothetical protein [Hoeflea olei]|uniref:Antibiotic biosynthesis monooxygenase n=1 Tax=Hoeflea olei TaxID=1480615 RepID=A0A1C1YWA4_9HYPH|nr:hypothetical protein [Hoeflea olei]OCW57690.1 hypothetical protein AWJ14_02455 [Hoeflea olei]